MVVFKHVSLLDRTKKKKLDSCDVITVGLKLSLTWSNHSEGHTSDPCSLGQNQKCFEKDSNLDVQFFKQERK